MGPRWECLHVEDPAWDAGWETEHGSVLELIIFVLVFMLPFILLRAFGVA